MPHENSRHRIHPIVVLYCSYERVVGKVDLLIIILYYNITRVKLLKLVKLLSDYYIILSYNNIGMWFPRDTQTMIPISILW